MKSRLRKLFKSRTVRIAFAGLALIFIIGGLFHQFMWWRDQYFATRPELVAYQGVYNNDLCRGTWYCGDKDGRSWFLLKQDIFGNIRLSMPSDQWQPSARMPYTFWQRDRWQDWYHHGIAKDLGVKTP